MSEQDNIKRRNILNLVAQSTAVLKNPVFNSPAHLAWLKWPIWSNTNFKRTYLPTTIAARSNLGGIPDVLGRITAIGNRAQPAPLNVLTALGTTWGRHFQEIDRATRLIDRLDRYGWLPHYTTPLAMIASAEEDDVDALICRHYREAWPEVKAAFLASLTDYAIAAESKDVFIEALTAHEHELYRMVPACLYPEIERLSRVTLHIGESGGIGSQRKLRKLADQVCIGDVKPSGYLSVRLFETLAEHAYARVDETFSPTGAKANTPNRHAVAHGLIAYNTQKTSLNALILTDFIFQIIHLSNTLVETEDAPPPP